MTITMTATTTATTATAAEFSERMLGSALGWIETMSIHLGERLGWYDALVAHGPLTAAELAAVTGTAPRYAHEWLEQQAASGIVSLVGPVDEPDGRCYALPEGAAEVLTDRASRAYTAPLARMLAAAGLQMPALLDAYRRGGGVSWQQLGDDARESQADANRPWLDAMPEVFARHPRLHARLGRPDARIADVGTGAGWSAIALARAYPELVVDGFDLDEPSIEMARVNAREAGVADRVHFHVADASRLAWYGPFDAAVAFECVHDMPDPVSVLAAMREATLEEGFVVVMDEAVDEAFAPEAGEMDRLMYGFSLFVCLPDGLSHPGSVGTGTVMRPSTLRRYARAAGYADIDVVEDGFGLWRFYELHRS